jgi:drug/metabolite transporter (DMT)-like permease
MYALASVFQQRGAEEQPRERALHLGLLLLLARHRLWVIGLGFDVAAFGLQFVALGHGPLVIVQPLLVCGLLFALPLGAAWAGRRLKMTDWSGAVLVCAGLAVFLVVANPESGRSNTGPMTWVAIMTTAAVATAALVLLSPTADARRRAILLSGAAGIVYGVAAALTKTSSHFLSHGVIHVFAHWQPYLLVVFGVIGMLLAQSSFQAGKLDVSLPTMTVVDPVVSILIGALAFHEGISSAAGPVALEIGGLVAMSIGIFMLAKVEAATGVV